MYDTSMSCRDDRLYNVLVTVQISNCCHTLSPTRYNNTSPILIRGYTSVAGSCCLAIALVRYMALVPYPESQTLA